MEKKFIILGMVIFIVSAGFLVIMPSRSVTSASPVATVVPVQFTTLAAGAQSKVTDRVNYLVTNQTQLNELWDFLSEPPPVPQVDFNTHVVAAVFAGKFSTAGYSIAVAAVEDATERIVKVSITKPGQGCMLAQSTVAPYQVVELPKTSLPFTHEDIATTKACQ
jgi:hypothetical protein